MMSVGGGAAFSPQSAVALGGGLQGLLGGEPLVNGAAGDDALRRAVFADELHQGPSFLLVGEGVVLQGQAPVRGDKFVQSHLADVELHVWAVRAVEQLFRGVEQERRVGVEVAGLEVGDEGGGPVHRAELLPDGLQCPAAHGDAGNQQGDVVVLGQEYGGQLER